MQRYISKFSYGAAVIFDEVNERAIDALWTLNHQNEVICDLHNDVDALLKLIEKHNLQGELPLLRSRVL